VTITFTLTSTRCKGSQLQAGTFCDQQRSNFRNKSPAVKGDFNEAWKVCPFQDYMYSVDIGARFEG
jgi:hypothetical protein